MYDGRPAAQKTPQEQRLRFAERRFATRWGRAPVHAGAAASLEDALHALLLATPVIAEERARGRGERLALLPKPQPLAVAIPAISPDDPDTLQLRGRRLLAMSGIRWRAYARDHADGWHRSRACCVRLRGRCKKRLPA